MKQRSILLIFCLSLVPISLSAASETPPQKKHPTLKLLPRSKSLDRRLEKLLDEDSPRTPEYEGERKVMEGRRRGSVPVVSPRKPDDES